MKKFTLILVAVLSAFCLQSQAQTAPTWGIIDTCKTTVVDQNAVFSVPSDDYLDITKAWIPADSTANKPKTKADGDGIMQFDNMRKGNFAVFHLNVTSESKVKVNMQMATKQAAATVEFALFNADHELEQDILVNATNTGNWSKFADNYFITDKAVKAGEKTLVIIFDGTKETVNLRQVQWTKFGNQATYSCYTNIVSDDDNEHAGTITMSPSASSFIEGTEITVTATPAEGYKFLCWKDIDGDVLTTSNSYTFNIYEDTDLDAYFKKLNMVNAIPGTVDPNTMTKGGKNGDVAAVEAGTKNAPRFITDYENKENADTLNIMNGVEYLNNFRDGDFLTLKVSVAKQAKYYINCLAASKQSQPHFAVVFVNEDGTTADSVNVNVPSTGQWFNYTKVNAQTKVEIPTTVNKVVIYFHEDGAKKYTENIMNLSFSEAVADPTLDAEGKSILIGGTTSGITMIKGDVKNGKNAPAYNLSGQRVSSDYKGIVVRNGKKYIVR